MNHVLTVTKKFSVNNSSTEDNDSKNCSCFEIRTIEWLFASRKQELEIVHMCQQFMIVWLCKGRLLHCIDLIQYKIEKDELYGIAPRQVHQITPIDNPKGYIIYLSAAAFEGIHTANLLFD